MRLQRNTLGCGYTGYVCWQHFIRKTSTEIGRSRKTNQIKTCVYCCSIYDLVVRRLMAHQTSLTKSNLFDFQPTFRTIDHSYLFTMNVWKLENCLQGRRPLWAIGIKFRQNRDVKTNHGVNRTGAEYDSYNFYIKRIYINIITFVYPACLPDSIRENSKQLFAKKISCCQLSRPYNKVLHGIRRYFNHIRRSTDIEQGCPTVNWSDYASTATAAL